MEPYQHTSGWWRRTDRGRLRLTGRDAVPFLQALVSNDVDALPVGGTCDAVYLTPQGRMITDMRILRRGPASNVQRPTSSEELVVSVPAELAGSLAARLDSLVFSEDVQVADISAATSHISVLGESMRDARDLIDEPPPPGVPELSASEIEQLRIEAGLAKWGVDMNEETIPLEAGLLERAISQTKGCYVGQEVIIRVLHRGGGRVARRLMKIACDIGSTVVPSAGTEISKDDIVSGHVTSAVFSAREHRVLALGYVKRDHAEPGTAVRVGDQPATLGEPAS
ncbi:MAG: folate-binding protein [Acidobacteria bacterium]|nr:MAG: folate-binding protein [Acidobacteriota bacterium]